MSQKSFQKREMCKLKNVKTFGLDSKTSFLCSPYRQKSVIKDSTGWFQTIILALKLLQYNFEKSDSRIVGIESGSWQVINIVHVHAP